MIRRIVGVLITTGLGACGGGGGAGESTGVNPPPPPPPPTRTAETVVYVASDGLGGNGETELYAVEDDGHGRRMLSADTTARGAIINSFQVSPDGQWVAYLSDAQAGGGVYQLYVTSIDGGPPQRISRQISDGSNRSVKSFDWSPDSGQLVYEANFDGLLARSSFFANEIFVVNRDGSGEKKINGAIGSTALVEVRNPQWSPDGRYIVQEVARFASEQGFVQPYALNVFDTTVGTPNSTRVVNADSVIRNVRWSPDGTRLAYMANRKSGTDYKVYVLDLSARSTVQVTDNGDFNSDSRWAPDASRLAYLDHPTFANPSDLIVSEATGEAPDTVLVYVSPEQRRVTAYEWSPDGKWLAYRSNESASNMFELYLVGADGGAPSVKLSGPMDASSDVFDFAWSPDGSEVAYIADQHTDTFKDLYVSGVDDGSNTRVSAGLNPEEVVEFAWSTDGQRLVFSTAPNDRRSSANTLYVSRPDGSARIQLTEPTDSGPVRFSYRE
jgi:Tol biopolymer transport system component